MTPSDPSPPTNSGIQDSRKFVHGTGYFGAVAVGAALVAAVLWRGAASPESPVQPSDGQSAAPDAGVAVALSPTATVADSPTPSQAERGH